MTPVSGPFAIEGSDGQFYAPYSKSGLKLLAMLYTGQDGRDSYGSVETTPSSSKSKTQLDGVSVKDDSTTYPAITINPAALPPECKRVVVYALSPIVAEGENPPQLKFVTFMCRELGEGKSTAFTREEHAWGAALLTLTRNNEAATGWSYIMDVRPLRW